MKCFWSLYLFYWHHHQRISQDLRWQVCCTDDLFFHLEKFCSLHTNNCQSCLVRELPSATFKRLFDSIGISTVILRLEYFINGEPFSWCSILAFEQIILFQTCRPFSSPQDRFLKLQIKCVCSVKLFFRLNFIPLSAKSNLNVNSTYSYKQTNKCHILLNLDGPLNL